MLEQTIRKALEKKDILLMTHIVIGYPDPDTSYKAVRAMVEGGVDLMELQIPFSEPIADGPVIELANQRALDGGMTVEKCIALAARVAADFAIPFLFMSYYNIPYRYGVARFAHTMREIGLKGAIIPDLPPEEAEEYTGAMRDNGLDPIFLFAPNTPPARMKKIAKAASGFIYCVARKGVTGLATAFTNEVTGYLSRARAATGLPLAVGFGIKEKADVDFLKGKAEIAIVGSEMLRVLNDKGPAGVGSFCAALR